MAPLAAVNCVALSATERGTRRGSLLSVTMCGDFTNSRALAAACVASSVEIAGCVTMIGTVTDGPLVPIVRIAC